MNANLYLQTMREPKVALFPSAAGISAKYSHSSPLTVRHVPVILSIGCINNLIYVVILSAAVDLVGAEVPKVSVGGIVLLADIAPSLTIKMTAPYFIHMVPYYVRVLTCVLLSFSAVVIIALAKTIPVRLGGVMMASLSSGLGELTFLMLSSFYRRQMISAWSSGTGGAGLLGALLFLALTSWIGLSIPWTMGVVSYLVPRFYKIFPIAMLLAYFILLSSPEVHHSSQQLSRQSSRIDDRAGGYQRIPSMSRRSHLDDEEELLNSQDDRGSQHQRQGHLYDTEHRRSSFGSAVMPPPILTRIPSYSNPLTRPESTLVSSPTGTDDGIDQLSQPTTGLNNDGRRGPTLDSTRAFTALSSKSRSSTPSFSRATGARAAALTETASETTATTALSPPMPPPLHWGAPSWEPPRPSQRQAPNAEPTSINTLLAATDPGDPNFVTPFREAPSRDSFRSGRKFSYYKVERTDALPFHEKLGLVRSLLVPYMGPLFLVYAAEYTMNQGVLPVILFPLERTPFARLRDHYVTYSALYQLGVFISRSSASIFTIDNLWIPSILQLLTLSLAITQALFGWISVIYVIFAIVFWEGLLGGATYVHTYLGISHAFEHDPKSKEFAMGAVGVADGAGILLAGVISLWLEPMLCRWQVVERGVELCLAMAD
ncbi:battenin CLN3 protein [Lunasporangiospora selenospora]|uniref:Battenin CLN3 protein n=1 Tax=Lunasporangiospora selenospora TaxID=979761 RepID=A0A9P6KGA2_9FUNG|nr:battenin CLN3 protein [Lunasporangiospora selenospora]